MKSSRWSMKRRTAIVAVTALLLGGAGGVAFAAVQAGPAGVASVPNGETALRTVPDYPKNDAGLTYGSATLANDPRDEPDLILAVASNGKIGYVKKTEEQEATGGNVESPQEAVEWQARMEALLAEGGGVYIPVYAVDGKTVIGQFLIVSGQ